MYIMQIQYTCNVYFNIYYRNVPNICRHVCTSQYSLSQFSVGLQPSPPALSLKRCFHMLNLKLQKLFNHMMSKAARIVHCPPDKSIHCLQGCHGQICCYRSFINIYTIAFLYLIFYVLYPFRHSTGCLLLPQPYNCRRSSANCRNQFWLLSFQI